MRAHPMLAAVVFTFFLSSPCAAVNFYDGARTRGLYALTYTSLYDSDRDRYRRLEELLRVCWYSRDGAVLTAFVPFGSAHSGGPAEGSSSGIGDVTAGAGYFLPVSGVDILPMLFVKFPTGEYRAGRPVNYGTNQYDIKPTVFLYYGKGRFSVDAAAKYFFRLENPATGSEPGDELHLQVLGGWQFTKRFKAGPSFNWYRNTGARKSGLSAGADLYVRLPGTSVTFTWLRDVKTVNAVKGDFFQVKTCTKF